MKYKVLTAFMDLQDKNHGYCSGDSYPRQGLTPTKERISELSGKNNKRGISLIKEIKESESKASLKKEE